MINRKRNRLTESQLREIVKESVKQVISELDWKTYANAARKWSSHLMKHPDDSRRKSNILGHENSVGTHDIHTDNRLRAYKDAMRKSFNDKYGMNALDSEDIENNGLGIRNKEGYFEMPWEDKNIGFRGYYDYLSTEVGTPKPPKPPYIPHRMKDEFDIQDISSGDMSSEPHRSYDLNGAFNKKRKKMDPFDDKFDDGKYPYMKARNKGNKEIMHYANGDYIYNKEKGWHLKDKQ